MKSKAFLFATVTWLHAPAEYCTVLLRYSCWFLWEIMSYSMCDKTNSLTPHPTPPLFIHRVDKHCLLPISPVTKKVKVRGLQRLSSTMCVLESWIWSTVIAEVREMTVYSSYHGVMKSPQESADQNKHLGPWHRRFAVTEFHRLHSTALLDLAPSSPTLLPAHLNKGLQCSSKESTSLSPGWFPDPQFPRLMP